MTHARTQLTGNCPHCEQQTTYWDDGTEIDAPAGWGCDTCGTAELAHTKDIAEAAIRTPRTIPTLADATRYLVMLDHHCGIPHPDDAMAGECGDSLQRGIRMTVAACQRAGADIYDLMRDITNARQTEDTPA